MNDRATPLAQEASDYYRRLLRPVFAGRKFLLTGEIAVLLGKLSRTLIGLDAERPFLLAGYQGTGPIPGPQDGELRMLGAEGTDILSVHRHHQQTLDNLTPELRHDIDAWDPDRTGRCILTSAVAVSRSVAGRQPYGARLVTWAELEDKVRIDAFWDAVGVRRAPSRAVAADYTAVRTAADALNSSHGTVWAADAREGTNGGGLGLRWVRPGDDGRESFAYLSGISDRVRVMPFLEGIPVRDGDDYREARSGEEPDGTFSFGPAPQGGFVRFNLKGERVAPGPSAAPEVVRAFRLADRLLGTEFGDLETARIVRPL